MFNTQDPNELWLIMTNLVLGAVAAICLGIVVFAITRELVQRARVARARYWKVDDDAFFVSNVGITMADGGERIGHKAKLVVDAKGKLSTHAPVSGDATSPQPTDSSR